jgi:nitroreductase
VHPTVTVVNRAGGGDEGLAGDLTAKDTLAIFLGRTATEHVDLNGFKVKKGDQVVKGFKHPYIMTRKSVFHTWFLASVSPVALLPLNPDELLSTTRAVRKRLDFDKPVPDELIRECVSLAMQSPSGSNSMTMQFIIVKDEAKRKAIGAVYRECFSQYQAMDGVYIRTIDKGDTVLNQQQQRSADSADYLGDHMGDAPVLVIPCNVGGRTEAAGGLGMMASSVMANILPAMWSFMLAARARGMGTAWTTVHLMMEQQVADILGIPFDTVQQVCLSPLAFTKGTDFKAAIRPDAETIIHWDKW